jgi:hypothetical protein
MTIRAVKIFEDEDPLGAINEEIDLTAKSF